MAVNYKKITTVSEASQLSTDATVFVNVSGSLRQAKLALITGSGSSEGTDSSALHFKGVFSEVPSDTSLYGNGDVIIVGSKEYVLYNGEWCEFGDADSVAANAEAIETIESDVETIKETLFPTGGTSLLSRVEALETDASGYIKNVRLNGVDQIISDGTVDLSIDTGNSLIGSDEITIMDNVLGIGEVDITKIVQDSNTELIFDAGTSA